MPIQRVIEVTLSRSVDMCRSGHSLYEIGKAICRAHDNAGRPSSIARIKMFARAAQKGDRFGRASER
jgi:hypothetical protein